MMFPDMERSHSGSQPDRWMQVGFDEVMSNERVNRTTNSEGTQQ